MERPLAAAVALLALGIFVGEWIRPFGCSHSFLIVASLLSIFLTACLWIRSSPKSWAVLTFLPALPIAIAILALQGSAAGAKALAVTAFAFAGRQWLFARLARMNRARSEQADQLESRLPEKVQVFVDQDIESEAALSAVQEGHLLRVQSGQIIPADGMITFGSGFVEESTVGESTTRLRGMGNSVFAGTLNKNGNLLFRVSAAGPHTFLSRIAQQLRGEGEWTVTPWLAFDALVTLLAAFIFARADPATSLRAFLLGSGASLLALAAAFEHGLAQSTQKYWWLWQNNGLQKFARVGMLTFRSPGVLSEGRPRLTAVETRAGCSEDMTLSLLGPLARKLEDPVAFALLQELRVRNIPLDQGEFFQAKPGGGSALVNGVEVRWVDLETARRESLPYPELEPFVNAHSAAGEQVHFLAKEDEIIAALAFQDPFLPVTAEGVRLLQSLRIPSLLVSSLPRSAAERIRTDLGLEHVLSQASEAETETLLQKLQEEGLRPAWVQTEQSKPQAAYAVAATPSQQTGAELTALRTDLLSLAKAVSYARRSTFRFRLGLGVLGGIQLGFLLLCLPGPLSALAASENLLALAGVLPGFLAYAWACSQEPA